MGLLSLGTPMHWKDVKPIADHVREHGIVQLVNIWNRLKGRQQDILLWGDEVECMVVLLDQDKRQARLVLRGKQLLDELDTISRDWPDTEAGRVLWHPEYGRYMIESTPAAPYGGRIEDMLKVEGNMALRRQQAKKALKDGEVVMTITVFPRLGCGLFTEPPYAPSPGGDVSKSLFFPDQAINEHPRFPTLTANIRRRRGSKVAMNIPIFRDTKTPMPFIEDFANTGHPEDPEGASAALPDHIYMDAMGFGMGNSCLQVTFQARNVEEARHLYDQLANVTPIFLALSASAPIFRGYLSDRDARWDVIAGSVDCRTAEERGLEPLKNDRMEISKSRYGSISSYLSEDPRNKPEFEDIPLEVDDGILQTLLDNGFDLRLARHFAHLFIRDPLVVFRELIDQDDSTSTDHFENLQSTNWQTMRFKPPPSGSDIGWRVEFRTCEVQFTDFENAAYTIFIVLLSRTILSFDLNLYMPLSKVDENMDMAQTRDAARQGLFWCRQHLTDEMPAGSPMVRLPPHPDSCELMTLDHILNGKPDSFPGLLPLVDLYLKSMDLELDSYCQIRRYLDFLSDRAAGKLLTEAQWIREYVHQHPLYQQDSVVPDELAFDLLKTINDIAEGKASAPTLLGDYIKPTAC